MKTHRIKALPLSSMELDKAVLMYQFHYGQKIQVPNVMWYIEGAEKNILVDTAADAKLATEFRGLPAKEIMSFEEALVEELKKGKTFGEMHRKTGTF